MSADKNRHEVRAPMSGIFYRSPSPDDPPYVQIDKVKSPVAGKIIEISLKNETPSKDNELLFVFEPA